MFWPIGLRGVVLEAGRDKVICTPLGYEFEYSLAFFRAGTLLADAEVSDDGRERERRSKSENENRRYRGIITSSRFSTLASIMS